MLENISISNISEHERELLFTVTSEKVLKEYGKALQKVQTYASFPGFRKGKVPTNIIEGKFSNEVKKIMLDKLIPDSLNQALVDQGLSPISEPQVGTEGEIKIGEPLSFKAIFQVKPSIEIKNYEGLDISVDKLIFTERDVEQELIAIQEGLATFIEPKDRDLVGPNDKILTEQMVYIDNNPSDKFQKKSQEISLFSHGIKSDLKEALLNKKIGEEAFISHTFAEDEMDKNLAGKEAKIGFKIISIKERVLPAIDDELAKDFSPEVSSLDELKTNIRSRLEKMIERRNNYNLKSAIIKKLFTENQFSAPPIFIERFARALAERELSHIRKDMAQKLLASLGDKFWQSMQEQGSYQAKSALLFEYFFDKLDIKTSEESIEKIIGENKNLHREDAIYLAKQDEVINKIKDLSHIKYVEKKLKDDELHDECDDECDHDHDA